MEHLHSVLIRPASMHTLEQTTNYTAPRTLHQSIWVALRRSCYLPLLARPTGGLTTTKCESCGARAVTLQRRQEKRREERQSLARAAQKRFVISALCVNTKDIGTRRQTACLVLADETRRHLSMPSLRQFRSEKWSGMSGGVPQCLQACF